ncbi:23S rRNA (adenine(2030)-N(6))-methyltransferase RlmJ [Paracoccus tegillarcae]|uniref:Ribosomal RNA large subunit methyltransferase J n=1 Tax=Paracoccus tegillarcae TaxID=1529068 RepID=A0A2K9EKH2_9RHOB|nr:23S rRNA (adenine(2030)-N(6))-methyltransferase RlmJ [Paracoccus tegillarcae]AUH33897.1 23S rRNA (adenine(2030)-N(6))-methyltransferase RlmJ [Paracoccus tegillarcae]
MLSYQHAYHAGNLADLHKHSMLAVALDYMVRKDKAMTYIETHAGRGLYRLDSPESLKTGEAAAGIRRAESEGWLQGGHPLLAALASVRSSHGKNSYPGSPLIASYFLRPKDSVHLAELHPAEHAALSWVAGSATIHRRDGFTVAHSLCPPTPRRGLMLIDPSYEVKTEYDEIPRKIAQIARKWNVGSIALWYPILSDERHLPMLEQLSADHRDVLRSEIRFPPLRADHNMIGSGMFVINPPWGLERETRRLEGAISRALGR